MTYITENSVELLRLAGALALVCLGIFFLYLCRVVYILTRVVRKANDLTDVFIEYVQKPMSVLIKMERTYRKFERFFGKK